MSLNRSYTTFYSITTLPEPNNGVTGMVKSASLLWVRTNEGFLPVLFSSRLFLLAEVVSSLGTVLSASQTELTTVSQFFESK